MASEWDRSPLSACIPQMKQPKEFSPKAKNLLIVTHPSTRWDSNVDAFKGIAETVRFAALQNDQFDGPGEKPIDIVYLKDRESDPGEYYSPVCLKSDTLVETPNGSLAFEGPKDKGVSPLSLMLDDGRNVVNPISANRVFLAGGFFLACERIALQSVFQGWNADAQAQGKKPDREVVIIADASYDRMYDQTLDQEAVPFGKLRSEYKSTPPDKRAWLVQDKPFNDAVLAEAQDGNPNLKMSLLGEARFWAKHTGNNPQDWLVASFLNDASPKVKRATHIEGQSDDIPTAQNAGFGTSVQGQTVNGQRNLTYPEGYTVELNIDIEVVNAKRKVTLIDKGPDAPKLTIQVMESSKLFRFQNSL
jgi:hypothetical protein